MTICVLYELKYCDMDKCCGNCKHFENEDASGKGWCEHYERLFRCEEVACKAHCLPNNGWTEITPDNVKELHSIKEEFLMIAFKLGDKIYYQHKYLMRSKLEDMADSGCYYYYVLPELKLEESK